MAVRPRASPLTSLSGRLLLCKVSGATITASKYGHQRQVKCGKSKRLFFVSSTTLDMSRLASLSCSLPSKLIFTCCLPLILQFRSLFSSCPLSISYSIFSTSGPWLVDKGGDIAMPQKFITVQSKKVQVRRLAPPIRGCES